LTPEKKNSKKIIHLKELFFYSALFNHDNTKVWPIDPKIKYLIPNFISGVQITNPLNQKITLRTDQKKIYFKVSGDFYF
jgi:hypothetical protein